MLNGLRRLAMERRHAIPLHMVIDYESGEGSTTCPRTVDLAGADGLHFVWATPT